MKNTAVVKFHACIHWESIFTKKSLFLLTLFILAGYTLMFPKRAEATNVSGTISTNTTWDVAGSPYLMTGTVTVSSGAILTVDAGVTVTSSGNYQLYISNGTLDVNGTSGNEVIFSHTTLTAANSWSGVKLDTTGTATIDYAKFYYANIGLEVRGGTATVNNSLFETNRMGISVARSGTLTTSTNTFNKHTYTGLVIEPDAGTVTLGSGGTADALGTDTNKNGYNAIGFGIAESSTNVCPANLCSFPQRTFAGISNIPYMFISGYNFYGTDDEVEIDAGVVIKSVTGNNLLLYNGVFLDVNGTLGNTVTFTSYRDDSVGGDTNNNGATSGAAGDFGGITLRSGANTVDYLNMSFATYGILEENSTTSLTVQDSTFTSNRIGIAPTKKAALTTARNTFNKQTYTALEIGPDAGTITLGSGATVDVLGTGVNLNGYNAIGFGYYSSSTNDCPSNLCSFTQRTFAGISNIPYIFLSGYNFSGTDDEVEIDAGVIIKSVSGNSILIWNGTFLDVNGTVGNPVTFTSYRDDTVGGDTNNNGATAGSAGDFAGITLRSGTNTVDYLNMSFATTGIMDENSTTSLTVQDSTFTSNRVGIAADKKAALTTARNTFNNQTYTGIELDPAVGTVTLGSGATVDVLGTGGNLNGYNAIGFGYAYTSTNDCPSNLCKFSQRAFAGISNIPYLFIAGYNSSGSDDEVEIDAGVVIKSITGNAFLVWNGSFLDVNGTTSSHVTFTSYRNDSVSGDTNNNGATSGSANDHGGISLQGTGAHTIDFLDVSYANKALDATATNLTINDSSFSNSLTGVYMNSTASPTFTRVNLAGNTNYGMDNNTTTVINAQNLYWGAADGPSDTDAAGQCGANAGAGNAVKDTATRPIDYCPYSATEFTGNASPTVSIDNLTGEANIYPGNALTIAMIYSDTDGASDLDELHLKITNTSGNNVEYYADEGVDGSGLTPTTVSGSGYITSITYDRDTGAPTANDITITWHITFDWDWDEDTLIEYNAEAVDDAAANSGWVATNGDYSYENDLTFTGTLTATGQLQGALTSGDWVKVSETIDWTGLKVVFQGTTTVYPVDADFDVRVADDDGGTWTDTVSSGANFATTSTADATTDTSDVNTVTITGIPTGGSDVSSSSFTVKVDGGNPATGSISISAGAAYTNTRNVTLTISTTDAESGVADMMVSESASFTGASWETYSTSKAFTLSSTAAKRFILSSGTMSATNPAALPTASP